MKSWSLQNRLALAVGTAVTVLWLMAALLTAHWLSQRVDEMLDDDLRATAQRILPLALHDLRGRNGEDEDHEEHEIDRLPDDDEGVIYQVRAADGAVLLQSRGASASVLPGYSVAGYSFTPDLRVYQGAVDEGRVTITVAEPLSGRRAIARSMLLQLLLPLLVVIPLSLLAIAIAIARGFEPLRLLGEALSRRGAQDLSPIAAAGLPRELKPFAAEVNDLLDRLQGAFEAERSFAANAAHELRTPVAGAIAQAQRLKAETQDLSAARRADEIEATLKRLMRTSEKLMQLARAEGGRMRQDKAADIRPVVRIIAEDFRRAGTADRCRLHLPDRPVPSVIEPDALGILLRNLIENALRHGSPDAPVEIDLTAEAVLTVSNDGAVMAPEVLETLTHRFQRGTDAGDGAGLGLAIVTAIAERAEAEFSLVSPVPGRDSGVSARVALPRG
jgi:two-component system, OmpR family, sensor kinase